MQFLLALFFGLIVHFVWSDVNVGMSIYAFQLVQHMIDGVQYLMDRGTSYDGRGTLYSGYIFSTNSLNLYELKNLNSKSAVIFF